MGTSGPADLPTLLARTLVAFGREASASDTDPRFTLPLWANVLRPLDGGARTMAELRAQSCISRRALTPALNALAARGWTATEGSGRSKATALTATGRAVAAAWSPVPGEVEARWRSDSSDGVGRLRAALVALVAQLPLELPHYPATYGTVDSTITGGGGVGGHGVDWKPVRRAPDGDVAGLPLHALLSQALVAFALDYEEGGDGWLTRRGTYLVAAGVLRHVADEGTPVDIPPFRPALPHWARYMVPRHGLGDVERGVIRLTARGRAWRDGHAGEVDRVMATWRAAYGPATVDELAAAAAAVADGLPGGLPDVPLDA